MVLLQIYYVKSYWRIPAKALEFETTGVISMMICICHSMVLLLVYMVRVADSVQA